MKFGKEIEITEEDYKAFLNMAVEGFKRLRIPKNKKDKVGIVIALKTENNQDKRKVENELVVELNRYLVDSNQDKQFYVYSFPDHLVEKINSHAEAKEMLIRSRGHFILHGTVAKRKIKAEDNYVFKLHGLIRHRPIQKIIQNQFEKEFSELLPGRIQFHMNDEGIYFELTKDWIGIVIKYIVGIAAFVSGDIKLSNQLYRELMAELGNIKRGDGIPVVSEIKKRLPIRILEVDSIYLERNYFHYTKTRKVEDLYASEKVIEEMLNIDKNNYIARLQASIIYFLKKDIDSAITILEEGENYADGTWRYNLGFLYAYKGDINNALLNYKKTFHKEVAENVCLDSEIFITEAINNNPGKMQLYFFRGLLNYKIKKDYSLAKEDFQKFIKKGGNDKFPQLTELNSKYLDEIKNNLGV